jgi:hypothetical protein
MTAAGIEGSKALKKIIFIDYDFINTDFDLQKHYFALF